MLLFVIPKYGIFIPIRSNGAFGIHVTDSVKFLTKLVTTMNVFDAETVTKYFRSLYVTKIKDTISSYLLHRKISILEMNAYIDEISQYMKETICPIMEEYGLELTSFYVNEISTPEDDLSVGKLKEALSKRAEMEIIGYNYQQERSFDTLENAVRKYKMLIIKKILSVVGITGGTFFLLVAAICVEEWFSDPAYAADMEISRIWQRFLASRRIKYVEILKNCVKRNILTMLMWITRQSYLFERIR